MQRIIYSLELDLGRDQRGQYVELIVPLDAAGRSPHIHSSGKSRAVDLRQGDWVRHQDHWFRVRNIRAYRDNVFQLSPGARFDAAERPDEGWLVE